MATATPKTYTARTDFKVGHTAYKTGDVVAGVDLASVLAAAPDLVTHDGPSAKTKEA